MTPPPSITPPRRLPPVGRHLVLAITFLTRLPLPVAGEVRAADLRASMGWYPLVGAGLGALAWGIYAGASTGWPAPVAAALTVLLLELATGALHLDGFMDTCDGLGSGKPRERALEIMKDSRVGAMGVLGAIAVILLKVTALASVPLLIVGRPAYCGPILLSAWAGARALPILNVTFFPNARPTGTGGAFAAGRAPGALWLALLLAFGLPIGLGGLTCGVLVGVPILLTLLVQWRIARFLGGLTGDVYGLGIELCETLALLLGSLFVTGHLPWISI